MLRSKSGHLIIELTVGLSIMCILLMTIASLGNLIIDQARIQQSKDVLAALVKHAEYYYQQKGSWPETLGDEVSIENKGHYLIVSKNQLTSTAYARLGPLGHRTYADHQ